jgi:hypothetical protein
LATNASLHPAESTTGSSETLGDVDYDLRARPPRRRRKSNSPSRDELEGEDVAPADRADKRVFEVR